MLKFMLMENSEEDEAMLSLAQYAYLEGRDKVLPLLEMNLPKSELKIIN